MTSPDPREPRRAPESINPISVIVGVGFVIIAILAALLVAFLQDLHSSQTTTLPKEGRLEFAEKAFQSGDNEVAVKIFSELAQKNNANAQYWLAHMTELGLGMPRNPAKAIELYKKAAAQNVVAAELRLGEIYLHGDIVPPDFTQAKAYLEQAAYHGDARAAMLLGQMYRLGLGMSADLVEAYAWSEVASLEGSVFAKRERDASLGNLSADKQQVAVAHASEILKQIKRETAPPSAPSPK
jgi:TPR repeat protein